MTQRGWTDEDKKEAARMWDAGKGVQRIAIAFSTSEDSIRTLIRRNRSIFPHRQHHTRTFTRQPKKAPEAANAPGASAPTIYADRVTRTILGSKITLPRVTFIDGPYQEAAE